MTAGRARETPAPVGCSSSELRGIHGAGVYIPGLLIEGEELSSVERGETGEGSGDLMGWRCSVRAPSEAKQV